MIQTSLTTPSIHPIPTLKDSESCPNTFSMATFSCVSSHVSLLYSCCSWHYFYTFVQIALISIFLLTILRVVQCPSCFLCYAIRLILDQESSSVHDLLYNINLHMSLSLFFLLLLLPSPASTSIPSTYYFSFHRLFFTFMP